MPVAKVFTIFVTTVFIQFGSSLSWSDAKRCCIKCPRAMDIDTFHSRVATGEDWVQLLFYMCPFDAPFAASAEQFRTSISVTNRVLTRVKNFRPGPGEPCNGAINGSFDQVGTKRAVFRRTEAGGSIREDRYLDTGALDDYYILFSCLDVGGARRGWCFNYFVTILIRHDPPTNFPWDKAIFDMKRFGIKARDFIYTYVGDVVNGYSCCCLPLDDVYQETVFILVMMTFATLATVFICR